MKDAKIYFRTVRAGGKNYIIYASSGEMDEQLGVEVHQENGYRFFVREEQGTSKTGTEGMDDVAQLPDEQSWSTFFPLDVFLLGRKRLVVHAMDRITQKLRAGSSPVKCFYKGCRRQALFFTEAPNSGGSWYCCGEQHMSDITTKGIPIPKENYKPIRLAV